MGSFVALHNKIYVGHLDLTGLANRIDFGPLTRDMKDATTYADGGYSCVKPGLIKGEARVAGFQDWAADVLDDEISVGQLGTQYPISVIPNASGTVAAGDPCWLSRGLLDSQGLPFVKGEMAAFDWHMGYDTAAVRGFVGHPLAARTSSADGTAVALGGPTASQSLYAALHVMAFSGLTNIVVKVQSDDNSGFSSATDRITFSTVTATTSEWKSVAGSFSSETHLRASWAVTGTGSCTFAVTFGVL